MTDLLTPENLRWVRFCPSYSFGPTARLHFGAYTDDGPQDCTLQLVFGTEDYANWRDRVHVSCLDMGHPAPATLQAPVYGVIDSLAEMLEGCMPCLRRTEWRWQCTDNTWHYLWRGGMTTRWTAKHGVMGAVPWTTDCDVEFECTEHYDCRWLASHHRWPEDE